MIRIYTGPGCGPCAALKHYLRLNDIEYEEVMAADHYDELNEAGLRSLPIAKIDGQLISGWMEIKATLEG